MRTITAQHDKLAEQQDISRELLEALKRITAFCDRYVQFVDVEPLLEAANAAIAKAEASR